VGGKSQMQKQSGVSKTSYSTNAKPLRFKEKERRSPYFLHNRSRSLSRVREETLPIKIFADMVLKNGSNAKCETGKLKDWPMVGKTDSRLVAL